MSVIDNSIHVADIYGSSVVTQEPWVIPKWVAQKFKNVEHALATMRILYDNDLSLSSKNLLNHVMLRNVLEHPDQ